MNLGNKKFFHPIIPFIIILAIIISLSPTTISAQENTTNSEIQNITETTADSIEINLEKKTVSVKMILMNAASHRIKYLIVM